MKELRIYMKIAITLYSIFLMTGCSGGKTKDQVRQRFIKPYPHTIIMSEGFQNSSQLNLSDIADSIRYVVLSKDKQVLIGGIRSVQLTDSNIYLKADNIVMRFDLSGKFLNSFGSLGRGPQEYLPGSIYTITPRHDKIIILRSAMYSYLTFNPNGNYIGINDFPVPRTLYDFYCISDSVFLCTFYYLGSIMKDYIVNSINSLAGLFDLNGNPIKLIEHPLKNATFSSSETRKVVSMAPLFSSYDNRLVLSPEGDTIYEIDNTSITKGFIINWGQIPHKQTIEELYFRQTNSDNNVSFWAPVYETYNKAYFRTISNNEYRIFEYDKVSGVSKSMVANPKNIGFINNLDGGATFFPIWTNRTGDIWIEYDDAFSFKEQNSENFLASSIALYPEMKENLKTLIKDLKQDDNPVLKFVYLKKYKE